MRAAIIPALDEEATIAAVVAAVRRRGIDEVIVVDNGSVDDTRRRAAAAGARVVLEARRGYGAACLAGIAALPPQATTVVFLDGDGSDDTSALGPLLALVERGEADLVIGSRISSAAATGALTLAQRVGNRFAGWLLGAIYGAPSTDLGPMRAIRADVLRSLGMRDRSFGWTAEMQARAGVMGCRIVEIPVEYRERAGPLEDLPVPRRSDSGGRRDPVDALHHRPARAPAPERMTGRATFGRRFTDVAWLGLGGSSVVAGSLVVAARPEAPREVLVGLGLAAGGYLVGIRFSTVFCRRPLEGAFFVLAVMLFSRIALALAPPVLEDDVYRYLWDGAVTAHGESPYRFSPQQIYDHRLGRERSLSSPSARSERPSGLAELSREPELEPAFLRINYPSVPTIYPPAMQVFFALVSALAPGSVLAMKLALSAVDLAVACLVAATVAQLGHSPRRALVYAWSPLVLASFAGSAHSDVVAIAAFWAAILAALRNRRAAAGAFFGVAVAARLIPLIAWPALRRLLGVRGTLAALATVALLYAPFAGEPRLFEGLASPPSPRSGRSTARASRSSRASWSRPEHRRLSPGHSLASRRL